VVDAMLGSLVRKLRAFGFDTLYYKEGDDEGIIRAARSTGRILVTADRRLAAASEKSRVTVLLVSGATDSKRIRSMIAGAEAKGLSLEPGESLCSLCNGPLVQVRRENVASKLPRLVAARHRRFLECTECHKLYWRGSHWKKLRRLRRYFVAQPVGEG